MRCRRTRTRSSCAGGISWCPRGAPRGGGAARRDRALVPEIPGERQHAVARFFGGSAAQELERAIARPVVDEDDLPFGELRRQYGEPLSQRREDVFLVEDRDDDR